MTGKTSVPVESAHHHDHSNLSNVYFRFLFDDLIITKWGYRYLLKITLRSNPACYTIETMFGPFNVQAKETNYISNNDGNATSTGKNDVHFVWTTEKCHRIKLDVQASIVIDRAYQQIISLKQYSFPSQNSQNSFISVPTSRFIDYLCDLNLEKFTIFLINFLTNRAASKPSEMIPNSLKTLSSQHSTRNIERKEFFAKRNLIFTNENNLDKWIENFIGFNRLYLNGTQCLQMNFHSKNISMLHRLDSSQEQKNSVQEIFNQHYENFVEFQRQQLKQKLINMTFIYSGELMLKIRQIYIDDLPIYEIPVSNDSKTSTTKKPFVNRIAKKNSKSQKVSSKKVGKRKSSNKENRTESLEPSFPNKDLSDKESNMESSKEVEFFESTSSSTQSPHNLRKDIVFKFSSTQKPKLSSAESFGNQLTNRSLIWIMILFVNTLLVFGFIVMLAVCYYRSK